MFGEEEDEGENDSKRLCRSSRNVKGIRLKGLNILVIDIHNLAKEKRRRTADKALKAARPPQRGARNGGIKPLYRDCTQLSLWSYSAR